MKLWGGRFSKNADKSVDDFNSSIRFDSRMYKEDIMGSIAHATMLGKQSIISLDESQKIVSGLLNILNDIEAGKIEFLVDAEDIHMNIEKILIERIGETGKKLHTGRSRNDQVTLDLRLYLKNQIKLIKTHIINLIEALISLSRDNLSTIMPGYTHLQKAQPITFAHHLMAYVNMLKRDLERLCDCEKRLNIMPLGSGALAGTTYPLNREMVAKELGFADITDNSLDGVSDRDYVIELSFCIALIMAHMSRFSEEIILWSTNEFAFIELDDAFSTGSSIMPQKKNPDIAELVRGKSGRTFGNLMGLLTVMKGIPLAYNKDMQEDKEAIFDSVDTVLMCLPVFTDMLKTMKLKKDNMLSGAKGGFTNATDLADYLVKKGIPFRDAHGIVGRMVASAIEKDKALDEFSMDEFKSFNPLIEEDIYTAISLSECVEKRTIVGGPASSTVENSIEKAERFVLEMKEGI